MRSIPVIFRSELLWAHCRFTTTYAISAYHHYSCEFEPRTWRGVLDTTLCDKVCQWLKTGRWFSPGTPVSSANKTDHQHITEILLKVALNTTILNPIFRTVTTDKGAFKYKDVGKIVLQWLDKGQYFYTQLSEITFIRYVYTENNQKVFGCKKTKWSNKQKNHAPDATQWCVNHIMARTSYISLCIGKGRVMGFLII